MKKKLKRPSALGFVSPLNSSHPVSMKQAAHYIISLFALFFSQSLRLPNSELAAPEKISFRSNVEI